MKQVKAFETSDGLLFSEKGKAEKHQTFLDKKDLVTTFAKSESNPYRGKSQLSIVTATIINWEMWKAKNASE
jgi:hypothetical protein